MRHSHAADQVRVGASGGAEGPAEGWRRGEGVEGVIARAVLGVRDIRSTSAAHSYA